MSKQNWEEEFDKLFCDSERFKNLPKEYFVIESPIAIETKNFIKDLRQKDKEEIVKMIGENHQGSFTDDGGNNCWYADELINLINKYYEL